MAAVLREWAAAANDLAFRCVLMAWWPDGGLTPPPTTTTIDGNAVAKPSLSRPVYEHTITHTTKAGVLKYISTRTVKEVAAAASEPSTPAVTPALAGVPHFSWSGGLSELAPLLLVLLLVSLLVSLGFLVLGSRLRGSTTPVCSALVLYGAERTPRSARVAREASGPGLRLFGTPLPGMAHVTRAVPTPFNALAPVITLRLGSRSRGLTTTPAGTALVTRAVPAPRNAPAALGGALAALLSLIFALGVFLGTTAMAEVSHELALVTFTTPRADGQARASSSLLQGPYHGDLVAHILRWVIERAHQRIEEVQEDAEEHLESVAVSYEGDMAAGREQVAVLERRTEFLSRVIQRDREEKREKDARIAELEAQLARMSSPPDSPVRQGDDGGDGRGENEGGSLHGGHEAPAQEGSGLAAASGAPAEEQQVKMGAEEATGEDKVAGKGEGEVGKGKGGAAAEDEAAGEMDGEEEEEEKAGLATAPSQISPDGAGSASVAPATKAPGAGGTKSGKGNRIAQNIRRKERKREAAAARLLAEGGDPAAGQSGAGAAPPV